MHIHIDSETLQWQQKLEDLAIASCAAPATSELQMMRLLIKLLSDCPDKRLIAGLRAQDAAGPNLALDHGFADAAVLQLISGASGFMLSHDGDKMFIASICLPGASAETTANGSSLALAMISAICISLADQLSPASIVAVNPG